MKSIALTTKHIVIIAAALVVVVAVGVGAFFIISNMNKPSDGQNLGGLGFRLDENMKDYDGRTPEDRGGEA